jgi:hypothetical protein
MAGTENLRTGRWRNNRFGYATEEEKREGGSMRFSKYPGEDLFQIAKGFVAI